LIKYIYIYQDITLFIIIGFNKVIIKKHI